MKMGEPKSVVFEFDDLDDVHEDIQSESSDVNASAVEASEAAVKQAGKDQQVDKKGVIFDPDLHAVDKDGNPSLTPLGKFRKKRGSSTVAVQGKAAKTIQDENAARAAGQLAADMLIGSAVTLLGDEWVPIGESGKQEVMAFDEHANMRRAFGDYFVAKGISDFPPGIMLSIALTSYAMPRFAAGKETKSRLAKAKAWVSEKWANMRSKKDATQSNSGNDGERKDDASEETVPIKQSKAARNPST